MRIRLLPDDYAMGRLPYAWLIFLGFFIAGMFSPPVTAGNTIVSIAGLAVFLFFYFRAFWIDGGLRLLLPIGVWVLLGVGFSSINPGASVFFTYAGFFAGRLGRWPYSAAAISAILLSILATWHFFDLRFGFLLTGTIVSIALCAMSIQIYAAEQVQRRLARSEVEVEQLATIAERERIARDLHDVMGHTLSVIALKSELARRLVDSDPEMSKSELEDIENIARTALIEVRNTITGFRSIGLEKEIETVRRSLLAAGIIPQDLGSPSIPELSVDRESAFAMVLKEAVTNVIRHSKAKNCRIIFDVTASAVELIVHDDGAGFASKPGNGINGMTERLQALGGSLSVVTNNGTQLIARFPKVAS